MLEYFVFLPLCLAATFLTALLFYASSTISSNFYIPVKCHGSRNSKNVAITFDDSPGEKTHKILKILNDYQVKATFFCIGEKIEKFPIILKSIIAAGHTVGCHSYSHSWYHPFMTPRQIMQETQKTLALIKDKSGIITDLYRPPFGVINPRISKGLRLLPIRCIGWDVRSFDTMSRNPAGVFRRICRRIKPGSILLFHDFTKISEKLIPMVLKYLQKKGYIPVTIEELLKAHISD